MHKAIKRVTRRTFPVTMGDDQTGKFVTNYERCGTLIFWRVR